MTGIYKKFKSGTDIRGIGIGNGDEPLYKIGRAHV